MGFAFKVYIVISVMHLTDAYRWQKSLSTTKGDGNTYLDNYGIPYKTTTDIPPIVKSVSNGPLIRSSSIGTIVSSSVGVVLIAGMVIFVLLSLKYCKKNDQSSSSETNTNYESEQQHRLDQVSEHRYDSLSVTTTHTYLELC